MGTITMTGYNNIDWTSILNAVMTQEAQPLQTMQTQYSSLQSRQTAYTTLATKLSALESAADSLRIGSLISGRTATSTDSSVVQVNAESTAMAGTYDVVVSHLARAQVTSTSAATAMAARDSVVAANGGNLTFNGTTVVAVDAGTTLEQLADTINSTADLGVKATIISADGKFQLVLTGTETGQANAFTVANNLDNGAEATIDFTRDVEGNLVNAVAARDSELTINNVRVTGATNTVTDAIPGATITLYKESATPAVLSIGEDSAATKTKISAFVGSYNDLRSYFDSQAQAASNGNTSTLATDAMARTLRQQLSSMLLTSRETGGTITNLAQLGVEFQRDGKIKFDEAAFDDQAESHRAEIETLLSGTDTTDGVFDLVKTALNTYTGAGGLLPDAKQRLTDQMSGLNNRMADESARLAIRRAALQREYAAADQTIAALNSQSNSLGNLNSGYRLY